MRPNPYSRAGWCSVYSKSPITGLPDPKSVDGPLTKPGEAGEPSPILGPETDLGKGRPIIGDSMDLQ